MLIPQKTLDDLEWPRLLEHLAQRSTGEEAANRCRELPFLEAKQAREQLDLVAELQGCFTTGDPLPALPAHAVGDLFQRLRSKGTVVAEALRNLAVNIKLYLGLARFLEKRRDACPKNAEMIVPATGAISSIGLARLAAEIESSFEPDGTISDQASSELKNLRRRVTELRRQLVARCEKITETEGELLQERTVTIRNDRYVVPVRADAHRRFSGIVHGTSGSGATIFVEPAQVVELGNELTLAREQVIREEERVLFTLAQAVADQLDEVQLACGVIVEAEVRIAAARLAHELDAAIPGPSDPGTIALQGARHPLLVLDGVEVVPGTICVAPGECLVVSGPNAGGKTVVLKTAGMLSLMLAAGLPIPASAESLLGLPQAVLSDIGDAQSLKANLSTFSAHMSNIATILDCSARGTVVLLDELAAGTDPGEGAALAEALLEQLIGVGATVLATTHFDGLKARAQAQKGFVNAAVGFDIEQMRPTFELRRGVPGASSALAVARRFGISEAVVERATVILPTGTRELGDAVEALERAERALTIERQALAEQRRVAAQSEKRHAEEIARMRKQDRRFLEEETEVLWKAIRAAREKVRQAETTVRRRRSEPGVVSKVRREINEVAEQLDPGGELSQPGSAELPGKPLGDGQLQKGMPVYVISLRVKGIVESPPRGNRVTVLAGNIRTRVQLTDIRLLERDDKKGTPRDSGPKSGARRPARAGTLRRDTEQSPVELKTMDNTVDLRGMTADEATAETDRFLDQALRNGLEAVFVLHGYGTGALRDAVRTYLAKSPYVAEFRPGNKNEGGDGITVAHLR